MAVFRVEKTRDYTIMANHHLKNRELSLKAKGLLSVMLSLPEDWDYTLKGLAHISKEGTDAIRQAIRELEGAGYILRNRSRNGKGQLGGAEYVIYERPRPISENPTQERDALPDALRDKPLGQLSVSGKPTLEKPTLDYPIQINPTQENPILGNPTQLNTKETNTHPEMKNTATIHPSNPETDQIKRCRREVRQRIDYYALADDPHESPEQLNEIVELVVETICSTKPAITVAGDQYPTELVKERFGKLTGTHIEYVTSCLRKNTTPIRNIKKYIMTALFNAPVTMDSYYTAQFNHRYYGSSQP